MTIDQINDYSIYNKPPYLLEADVGGEVEKLIKSFDRQFNELEAMMVAFFSSLGINIAVGDALDIAGSVLNVNRGYREDSNFRAIIKLRAFLNHASGTPEDLIQAVATLYGATDVVYSVPTPANVLLMHNGAATLMVTFDMIFSDGDDIEFTDGDTMIGSEPDPVLDALVELIAPAGVGTTIEKM